MEPIEIAAKELYEMYYEMQFGHQPRNAWESLDKTSKEIWIVLATETVNAYMRARREENANNAS